MRRLILIALLLSGCTSFDPISFLSRLRVVTMIGAPPELAPGQSATVTAVLPPDSALDGGAFDYAWAYCTMPPVAGAGETVSDDCITHETAPYLIPLPSGAPTTMVTMPKVTPLALGLPDGTGGFYLPVRLRVSAAGQTLTSVYRLRLNLDQPPNQNPVIDGVFQVGPGAPDAGGDSDGGAPGLMPLVENMPIEVHAGDVITLRATTTAASHETYLQPSGSSASNLTFTPTVEQPGYDWYATAGEFDIDTTGDDRPDTKLTFDKHLPPSGATVDLYVVALDHRGGTAVAHRTLVFR
ncbi:MAG TPA: hypothetical protein VII38_08665 [Polyangia bacterium]